MNVGIVSSSRLMKKADMEGDYNADTKMGRTEVCACARPIMSPGQIPRLVLTFDINAVEDATAKRVDLVVLDFLTNRLKDA